MRKTKRALLTSLLAMLLCISMLTGTTFAWFTDSVTSSNNIIQSGNLDVQMFWTNDLTTDVWFDAEQAGAKAPFDYDLWEPGYTEVRYVQIVNAGNLALKYSLTLAPTGAVGKLAEVIGVYYAAGVSSNVADRSLSGMNSLGYLKDAMNGGEAAHGSLLPGQATIVAVALHMDEDAGNDYQNESIGDGFVFKLLATQMTHEGDSFGPDYDAGAGLMGSVIHFNVEQPVADKVENGALVDDVNVGSTQGEIFAQVPSGVKLANGANSLGLSVDTMQKSEANVTLEKGEVSASLDIHMDGVAEDNTVPMLITLKGLFRTGLNSTSVAMYHVENGVTVPMTQVANPVNHNEFSYDPATGDVTVAMASFSEVMAVADNVNPWDGTTATAYTGTGTESDPYLIATAEQLAYFRIQVDNGKDYAGEFVKLSNDINLNSKNFDPIGWGYAYEQHNREVDGVHIPGKVFKGTFDGNGKTIFGLYQNGWDLEAEDPKNRDYTYTNCGFGLFAAACDATFRNLTISGAEVIVECVEAGILVGLSQGACKYENINIYKSTIANYQRPAGGVVGEVSPKYVDGKAVADTQLFTNINIGSAVVVGSLWGDFDTPVGGVIGARWDDSNVTKIQMENVTVSCQLDVYSDVTAAYQWYAYRRAGMLIGNTDTPPADGKNAKKATAPFLICVEDQNTGANTVKVYLGGWNDYHYCRFSNEQNPGRNYPWVRVEEGRNNSAYSNPRYGHPTDANGKQVTDANHAHGAEDPIPECHNVSIPFNQLYGGGQGVYGVSAHKNAEGYDDETDVDVITYDYTVTYWDRGDIFKVDYVNADEGYEIKHEAYKPTRGGAKFKEWVNAGGQRANIPENNKENIVVYDSWDTIYTARYVDQSGVVFFEEEFTGSGNLNGTTEIPDLGEDFVFTDTWDIYDSNNNRLAHTTKLNEFNLTNIKYDIKLFPIYQYSGDVRLIPIDETGDGDIEYYQVAGFGDSGKITLVELPNAVNGIPVTTINEGAFKSFDDLYAAKIPANITSIGANAFTEKSGTKRDQVTLYYQGNPEDWKHAMDELYVTKPYSYYTDYNTAGTYTDVAKLKLDSSWDSGAGDGSRIFFLDANGKVNQNAGYWELFNAGTKKNGDGWLAYGEIYVWVYHNHPYDDTLDAYKNCSNAKHHYKSFTDYDATDRPDRDYWTPLTTE